ncbi:MAG: fimbrillin family protein [Rikenellaceae bacterium]
MKNLFKLALLSVAVASVSCASHSEVVPEVTENDAIKFSTFMDQATKGVIFDDASIQVSGVGFGIMGYYTKSAWNNTAIPNLMYNTHATYGNGLWSYSPVKFWSNIAGEKYSFFVYAPYSTAYDGATGITLASDNDDAGAPQIKFELQESAADMIDFVAGQEIDIEQQKDAVKFNLKHQLTRVTFSAKSNIDVDATSVVVKDLNLIQSDGFYSDAIYTFNATASTTGVEDQSSEAIDPDADAAADHTQDGTWSSMTVATANYPLASVLNLEEYTAGSATDGFKEDVVVVADSDETPVSLFKEDQYLFLLPPNSSTGIVEDQSEVMFNVTYSVVTEDEGVVGGCYETSPKTAQITLPAGSLKQGKAYNILLTIELDAIKVSANVVDWDIDNTPGE